MQGECERPLFPRQLGLVGGPRRARHRLGEAPLPEARVGLLREQQRPQPRGAVAVRVEFRPRRPKLANGGRRTAEELGAQVGPPACDLPPLEGVALRRARIAVRHIGPFVLAEELEGVPELAEHGCALLVVDRAESTTGHHRAVEVDDHLAVSVGLLRDACGHPGVAPRPVPVLGAQEVEREQRGDRIRIGGVTLERLTDLAVQLQTLAEREALVRRFLQQGVAEADLLSVAVGDELGAQVSEEVRPRLDRLGGEQLTEKPTVERAAEHRGEAKHAAWRRRQGVDLAHGHGIEGVGERLHLRRSDDAEELLQEQGVATRTGHDRVALVRSQRCGLRRHVDQFPCDVVAQERERQPGLRVRWSEATGRLGAARDAEEPGARGRSGGEPAADVRGRVVEPVGVFGDDQERGWARGIEGAHHQVGYPGAGELLGDGVALGRGGHIGVDHGRQQGGEGKEATVEPGQRGDELAPRVLTVAGLDAEDRAQRRAQRLVRVTDAMRLALQPQDRPRGGGRRELVDETGLADTTLGVDEDGAPPSGRGRPESVEQGGRFLLPTAEGERAEGVGPRADGPADPECLDGLRLSLHRERLQGVDGELRPPSVENAGGGEDLAGLRGGHEPRREVDRVPHDGEGPSVRRADVAGEHVPPVHADPDRERMGRLGDAAGGPQEAALVVLERRGDPRDEDDLAPVGVDVRGQEGDGLGVRRVLDGAHDRVECSGGAVGAVRGQEVVDTLELDEGDTGDAVLGLATTLPEPGTQRDGDAGGDGGGGHRTGGNRAGPTVDHVAPAQQATFTLGATDGTRRQAVRRRRADHDLAGVGRLLHAGGGRGRGPRDQELVVGRTDTAEEKRAAVDPDRHQEVDTSDRGGNRPRLAQGGAHGDRPLRGHGGVVVAGEGQEQGVPAELQERSALGVRDLEHPGEHEVQDFGEFFGADATAPGQPFGQGREPRDVDEAAGGLQRSPAVAGWVEVPLQDEARDVGREPQLTWRVPHRNQPCTRTGSQALAS